MELKDKKEALKLHSAGMAKTREGVDVPGKIDFPENLFVIGTVNIDETTYMFSPKVLDRAHVIEFEVDRGDVGKFLDDPKPLQPVPRAPAGQAEAFLDLSLRARGLEEPPLPELPPAVKTEVNKHLLEVLEILQNGRFEFAFRTAKEVVAYLKVSHELAADKAAWEADKWASCGRPAIQLHGAGRRAPDRNVPVWESQDLHESDMILAYCSNMRIPSARSMALPTAMDGGAGAASLGNAKPSVFPHGAASTSL
jgi:5-methylcytosine-specific restriction protein B